MARCAHCAARCARDGVTKTRGFGGAVRRDSGRDYGQLRIVQRRLALIYFVGGVQSALISGVCGGPVLPAVARFILSDRFSEEFGPTIRAFAATQAAFAAILASMSPFVLVFYASGLSFIAARWFST